MKIRAVSLDFYLTLICPANGKGRGLSYQEFLFENGLNANPWEHQVLYDVFEYFGDVYQTNLTASDKDQFWIDFTRLLFQRTNVTGCTESMLSRFAPIIRSIFGPEYFSLFPEVHPVLLEMKRRGLQIAVISNWQRGLVHFCRELGIQGYLSEILASGEVGYAKPDSRIFEMAANRLKLLPQEILHVGDSWIDDIEGARGAGFNPVLMNRNNRQTDGSCVVISSLTQLLHLI